MIAGLTYYQILWFFLIYSVLGWAVEVAFHGVTVGKVINRGFLNGPVCPVYGFGMVFVLMAFHEAINGGQTAGISTFQLFLGGSLLATAVEFIGGFALDKLFHARWWDYRNRPLNFNGYICLSFSILWGLAICFVVKEVHPAISRMSVEFVPEKIGWWILLVCYLAYFSDTVVTVLTVRGLNRELEELDRIRASMRIVSDSMSEVIGTTAITTARKVGEKQVQAALARAELKDAAQEARAELAQNVQEAKANLVQSVQEVREKAAQSAQEAKASLAQSVQGAREKAAQSAQEAKASLAQSVQGAREKAVQSALEAKEKAAQGMLDLRGKAAQGIWDTLEPGLRWKQALKKASHSRWSRGVRRLLKAFPELTHRDYEAVLQEWMDYLRHETEVEGLSEIQDGNGTDGLGSGGRDQE